MFICKVVVYGCALGDIWTSSYCVSDSSIQVLTLNHADPITNKMQVKKSGGCRSLSVPVFHMIVLWLHQCAQLRMIQTSVQYILAYLPPFGQGSTNRCVNKQNQVDK